MEKSHKEDASSHADKNDRKRAHGDNLRAKKPKKQARRNDKGPVHSATLALPGTGMNENLFGDGVDDADIFGLETIHDEADIELSLAWVGIGVVRMKETMMLHRWPIVLLRTSR